MSRPSQQPGSKLVVSERGLEWVTLGTSATVHTSHPEIHFRKDRGVPFVPDGQPFLEGSFRGNAFTRQAVALVPAAGHRPPWGLIPPLSRGVPQAWVPRVLIPIAVRSQARLRAVVHPRDMGEGSQQGPVWVTWVPARVFLPSVGSNSPTSVRRSGSVGFARAVSALRGGRCLGKGHSRTLVAAIADSSVGPSFVS